MFGASSLETAGRYYFSPPGTPPLPFFHPLGSRDWLSTNSGLVQPALGEVLNHRHRWDTGARPVYVPLPVLKGDHDCIQLGEPIDQGYPAQLLDDGFFPQCFGAPGPLNVDFQFGASVWHCTTQLFWADRMRELYAGEDAECVSALLDRFDGSTVTLRPGTTLFPPYVLVVHPEYACAILLGTQSYEQVVVQVLATVIGPTNIGNFSTGLLWFQFAQHVLADLVAKGVTDNRPLFFAGHSYGGASSLIASAIARRGQEARYVRYLTFGAPKPGDVRLQTILRDHVRGLSIVNAGDIIGALPPDLATIQSVQPLLGLGSLINWAAWTYPPETALQRDGQLFKNTYQQLDTFVIVETVQYAIAHGSLFGFPRHVIGAYIREIEIRCPRQNRGVGWKSLSPGKYGWRRFELATPGVGWTQLEFAMGEYGWTARRLPALVLSSVALPRGEIGFGQIEIQIGKGFGFSALQLHGYGLGVAPLHEGAIGYAGVRSSVGRVGYVQGHVPLSGAYGWLARPLINPRYGWMGIQISGAVGWTASRLRLSYYGWVANPSPRGRLAWNFQTAARGAWGVRSFDVANAHIGYRGFPSHIVGIGFKLGVRLGDFSYALSQPRTPIISGVGLGAIVHPYGGVSWIGGQQLPAGGLGHGILLVSSYGLATISSSSGSVAWWPGTIDLYDTCPLAILIGTGETITDTFRPGEHRWYSYTTAGEGMMHVDFVQGEGGSISIDIFPGDACLSFGPGQGGGGGNQCLEADATGWANMYVEVINGSTENGTFSFTLNDGAC